MATITSTPPTERVLLRAHAHAPEDGGAGKRGVEGERVQVLVDLRGQLAGGSEDEGPGGPARLVREALQDGQDEGRGLAAARHGAREQVVAGEGGRHGLLLDGRRAREAELVDAAQQVVVEAEAGKRHEKRSPRETGTWIVWNGDRR